jgi:hypothetical protein
MLAAFEDIEGELSLVRGHRGACECYQVLALDLAASSDSCQQRPSLV